MVRKKLIWQIYPLYLVLIVGSLVTVAIYASYQMKSIYLDEVAAELEARVYLIQGQMKAAIMAGEDNQVNALCRAMGSRSGTRITVVGPEGRVLGDSKEDPQAMENHRRRPEIAAAFLDSVGVAIRFSNTLQQNMMYVAAPVHAEGRIIGVVRTSLPITAINQAITSINIRIAVGGLIIVVLATVASLLIFRRVSRPLHRLREGAQRFARGELDGRLPVPESDEIGSLAEAMNDMSEQLDRRIRTIVAQRNQQEAVLSSMIEGVLAVDSEERLININRAAADLFDLDAEWARGRSVQEAIRNVDVQAFIARTLTGTDPIEAEIVLYGDRRKILEAHGTVLWNAEGDNAGAVVVFYDLTHIKKLENIRREFVANVSHELKTPITAIKGFVETLRETAAVDPEDTQRFLAIINTQTDRLNAIVDDLLLLSRIEKEAEAGEMELTPGRVRSVVENAVSACEGQAKARRVRIEMQCDDILKAAINARQLEQAVINLIDNAVKYSDPESSVQVIGSKSNDEVIVSVRDRGCGIENVHQERLFERFYRVDKARSKELGGTGLGLAIVKHIALAHGGRVGVESAPGKGSVFTIYLPTID